MYSTFVFKNTNILYLKRPIYFIDLEDVYEEVKVLVTESVLYGLENLDLKKGSARPRNFDAPKGDVLEEGEVPDIFFQLSSKINKFIH